LRQGPRHPVTSDVRRVGVGYYLIHTQPDHQLHQHHKLRWSGNIGVISSSSSRFGKPYEIIDIIVGMCIVVQAVPLYLSEMAPAKWRGGLNVLFQLAITIGILFANLINYTANKFIHHVGWRVALAIAGVPALLLTLGGFILPDTPASLIQRGDEAQGRKVLEKVRGTTQVHREFRDLVQSSVQVQVLLAKSNPFRNILKRRNRPQLVIALLLQLFQQFTGINAVMFYAPVLFQTLGFQSDASLYSAVILGAVNVLSTVVSIVAVDRLGRRFLLLQAGFQMFLAQVIYFLSTISCSHVM
jgi:MFS family permease